MKTILTALALVGFLLAAPAHAAVEVGKPAPDFKFTDINGNAHSISGFKGKTVVLEWTNPGCPFVVKFYKNGDMPKFQEQALADPNVVWVSINSSARGKEGSLTVDEAKKLVTEKGIKSSAYVLDPSGEFGKLYGAKTTPHMFVMDKDGIVQYQGAIDSIKSFDSEDISKADNYVLNALEALAAGKTPAVTSTESYGCSVKY
jgi:peroxiredoxin